VPTEYLRAAKTRLIAYTLPFILYLLSIQVCASFSDHYVWLYPTSVLVVGTITILLLRHQQILRPHRRMLAGVLVGLVGIVLWILLSSPRLEEQIGRFLPAWLYQERVGYNPFDNISHPFARWAFIVVRFAGLALLVPVVEELFWRGFLLRWLISADWERQPLGSYSLTSFVGVTLLFTLAHPEWLAAAVYCSLLNGLMYWKRDLWVCIVAHSVSNLVLGIYVLATRTWMLW